MEAGREVANGLANHHENVSFKCISGIERRIALYRFLGYEIKRKNDVLRGQGTERPLAPSCQTTIIRKLLGKMPIHSEQARSQTLCIF